MAAVRPATPADAEAIAAIYAPYVAGTAISFEATPPSPAEMAQRIGSTLERFPFLVFDDGDDVVGYAYAGAFAARAAYRWSVEVTVYTAPNAHRRGVGRALYAVLLDQLTRQGFHAAFAGIALPNDNSVGLHEAMGFVHVGTYAEVGFKLGAWRDVGWWRRSLGEGLPGSDPLLFPSPRA